LCDITYRLKWYFPDTSFPVFLNLFQVFLAKAYKAGEDRKFCQFTVASMDRNNVREIILRGLRANSRLSLSGLSRETKIPLQTILASFRRAEREGVVRYTSLLEPKEMGYSIKVNFLLKARDGRVRELLEGHRNINNCCRLMDEGMFYAECFFRDMKELDVFRDGLLESGAKIQDEAFVTEELKREGFMCDA
jgi:DNA-binding Lrp family transcriptional regulator